MFGGNDRLRRSDDTPSSYAADIRRIEVLRVSRYSAALLLMTDQVCFAHAYAGLTVILRTALETLSVP